MQKADFYEIPSFLRKDARVRDYQRLTVEEFESRVVSSAPQIRRAAVDETAIVGSAAFTEAEDGRPVHGIMLAVILGLVSWVAIAAVLLVLL